MTTATEQVYGYAGQSAVRPGPTGAEVLLSTSGGDQMFFDGFIAPGEQFAIALLVVARVARSRFWTPPNMVAAAIRAADPVVTANHDVLRFESFSACGGVHARLDVLPAALTVANVGSGTTNVDFNQPMRDSLARIAGGQALHLAVGRDVTLDTAEGTVVERKVPLPERWFRGFAEVHPATVRMRPRFDLDAGSTCRFLQVLPRSSGAGQGTMLAAPTVGGARLTTRPGPDTVPLAGAERLRLVEPLLPFATRLRAYAADGIGVGVWELTLPAGRLALTLSPAIDRGFSGEGGVLWDLADETSIDDADQLASFLHHDARLVVQALADRAGIPVARAGSALLRLGVAGRVGYDCAEGAHFHRDLPFDSVKLKLMHPRLRDARSLVASGAVRLDGADVAYVRTGDTEHAVRTTVQGESCTCPWFGRHRGERGPCKHVLAAVLQRRATNV